MSDAAETVSNSVASSCSTAGGPSLRVAESRKRRTVEVTVAFLGLLLLLGGLWIVIAPGPVIHRDLRHSLDPLQRRRRHGTDAAKLSGDSPSASTVMQHSTPPVSTIDSHGGRSVSDPPTPRQKNKEAHRKAGHEGVEAHKKGAAKNRGRQKPVDQARKASDPLRENPESQTPPQHGSGEPSSAALTNPEHTEERRTYDAVIRRDLHPRHYVYPTSGEGGDGGVADRHFEKLPWFCDPVTVPFAPSNDERCISFLRAALESAAQVAELSSALVRNIFVRTRQGTTRATVRIGLEPLVQRFEQRTIKFRFTVDILAFAIQSGDVDLAQGDSTEVGSAPALATIRALVKVPQVLFPIEPFAEVAAFNIDRALRIHRVPPTALIALPIEWIRVQSLHRSQRDMPMVPEFLEASHVKNYDEWIEKDFVAFVRSRVAVPRESGVESEGKSSRGDSDGGGNAGATRFTKNSTHAWCSVQLYLWEVQPLLYSPLRVPYSKSNPGWHRWFDVEWKPEYPISFGPLLALSELAVFDCIVMNNDRSPNKNNFIVGGCKNCDPKDRRPSGVLPTLVHLDHGMSFYGKDFPIPHNPLGKIKSKVRFCLFYRPQVEILRHLDETVNGRSEERWRAFMLSAVDPVAAASIGVDKVRDTGSQVVKVLRRLDYCLKTFNESVVLRP